MECPKCRTEKLKPTKLEKGLSAMGCSNCSGAIVSLLYYRDWVEFSARSEEGDMSKLAAIEEIDDTHSALACPKCKKIMTKYKVSGRADNRLDLCASCDDVWLDGGEWALLKHLEISRQMPAVFTDQWQRKIREKNLEDARDKRVLSVVNENELEALKRIRSWLSKHPGKKEIIFYLNHE